MFRQPLQQTSFMQRIHSNHTGHFASVHRHVLFLVFDSINMLCSTAFCPGKGIFTSLLAARSTQPLILVVLMAKKNMSVQNAVAAVLLERLEDACFSHLWHSSWVVADFNFIFLRVNFVAKMQLSRQNWLQRSWPCHLSFWDSKDWLLTKQSRQAWVTRTEDGWSAVY